MVEVASLEFRLRKIDETRNYLLDETKHNYLMNEKYQKTCQYLNYVKNVLVLPSAITGCVSISAFASSICVLVGITNSVVGLNICAIIVGIKEYKSIVQEKKKKHHKIVLFTKR